jgi:hypothetical protein
MGGFLRRHKTSGLMPLVEALGGDGVMGRYLAEVPVVQIVGTMARAGLDRLRATGTRRTCVTSSRTPLHWLAATDPAGRLGSATSLIVSEPR